MMLRLLAFFALLCCWCYPAWAEVSLRGAVLNENRVPVSGARVVARDAPRPAVERRHRHPGRVCDCFACAR